MYKHVDRFAEIVGKEQLYASLPLRNILYLFEKFLQAQVYPEKEKLRRENLIKNLELLKL